MHARSNSVSDRCFRRPVARTAPPVARDSLTLPPDSLEPFSLNQQQARQKLGIATDAAVVLWLSRLSLLTKVDPWPTYMVLERVARQLRRPLVY